jgi:hypothetical protein
MSNPPKTAEPINPRIVLIREQRVILDFDLARLYGVPTKRFNEALRRNRDRFPPDFAFQITFQEFSALREAMRGNWSQFAASSVQLPDGSKDTGSSSQSLTGSRKHRGATYRPWAFNEHGALMAANILRSARAREMSIFVIRAFVKMREELAANAAILKRLAEIDKTLLVHDAALRDLYQKLLPLLSPPPDSSKPKIGFHPGNR